LPKGSIAVGAGGVNGVVRVVLVFYDYVTV